MPTRPKDGAVATCSAVNFQRRRTARFLRFAAMSIRARPAQSPSGRRLFDEELSKPADCGPNGAGSVIVTGRCAGRPRKPVRAGNSGAARRRATSNVDAGPGEISLGPGGCGERPRSTGPAAQRFRSGGNFAPTAIVRNVSRLRHGRDEVAAPVDRFRKLQEGRKM